MYINQMVRECDFTGEVYSTPVAGAAAVARGATGRWCEVMHAGPEYLEKNAVCVITPEAARIIIEKSGDGYADF